MEFNSGFKGLIIAVRLREAYNLLSPVLCNFLPSHIISSPASVEFSSTKYKIIYCNYFSSTVWSVTTVKHCTYSVEIHIASRGSIWAGNLYVRGHQNNLFSSWYSYFRPSWYNIRKWPTSCNCIG